MRWYSNPKKSPRPPLGSTRKRWRFALWPTRIVGGLREQLGVGSLYVWLEVYYAQQRFCRGAYTYKPSWDFNDVRFLKEHK